MVVRASLENSCTYFVLPSLCDRKFFGKSRGTVGNLDNILFFINVFMSKCDVLILIVIR